MTSNLIVTSKKKSRRERYEYDLECVKQTSAFFSLFVGSPSHSYIPSLVVLIYGHKLLL